MFNFFRKKPKDTWVLYRMFDTPGNVNIVGCYTNHDKCLRELYRLKGQFEDRKYGLQKTTLNPPFSFYLN